MVLSSRDPERLAAAVNHARAGALSRIDAAPEATGARLAPVEIRIEAPSEEEEAAADAEQGAPASKDSEKRRL